MRKIVALSVCVLLAVPPAGAVPGVTTTDVNFRTGPGTQNPSLGVLAAGTPLDIVACNEGGIWCSVDVNGESGFVSGHYLQETAPPVDEPAGADVAMPGDDDTGDVSFSEAELDELVAPIALYPDSLLTQVLVAATVPLDIVKADRWVKENEKLATEEREAAASGQGWEESVAVLAAGFPEVIEIMAGDLDWTEDLGEAVLIQNDDVLDAVQRQRARAQAVGNLETNEAQVVASEDDAITIAPAQPDVVYVPQYDPVTTYTTPVSAAPVYVEVDDGYDAGAILATGAIAFGAGLAINSVFNSGYRDYWYGPNNIVWNQNNIYPRPGRPGPPGWHGRPGDRPGSPGWAGRPGDRPGGPNRPGRPGVGPGRPDAPWRPDSRRREEARRSVRDERRQGNAGQRPGAGRPAAGARPAGSGNQRVNRQQMESKLKARSGNPPKANRPAGNRPAGSRPAGSRPASAARKGSAGRSGAVSRPKKSSAQTRKAANRGKASASRKSASRPAARTQQVRKPRKAQPAQRRASPNRSAFSRSARPGRTSANRSRGRSSRGRGGGGRGRGGGGRGRR